MKNEGVFNVTTNACKYCGKEVERNTKQKVEASCFECKREIDKSYHNLMAAKKRYETTTHRIVIMTIV